MADKLVVGSAEVRISPGVESRTDAFGAPVLTIDQAAFAVAPGKAARARSLSIAGAGGAADTDLLAEARRVRRETPVMDGVLDTTRFTVEALPLAKFDSSDVLPVGRGGTGMRSPEENRLIVGKGAGADGLEAVPEVELADGVLSVRGTLRLDAPGGGTVALSSGLDDHGRPALFMLKPDGEKVDVTRVRSSLPPVIDGMTASYEATEGKYVVRATFRSYQPTSLVVSAYRNAQGGTKTSQEILESYSADQRAVTDLAGDVQQGYPSRVRYENVETRVELPAGFVGVLCCVVKDAWGNVSDPAEFSLDLWEFVVTQKADGTGGPADDGSVGVIDAPGRAILTYVTWDQTAPLDPSMISSQKSYAGLLSNLFDQSTALRTTWDNHVYSVGDTLFAMNTPRTTSSVTWTISYLRPLYRPGFKIRKNGVDVYIDTGSVATDAASPSPASYLYVYPYTDVYEFQYVSYCAEADQAGKLAKLEWNRADALQASWLKVFGTAESSADGILDGDSATFASFGRSVQIGSTFMKINVPRLSTAGFNWTLTWANPRLRPAIRILRNGVRVLTESSQQWTETTPAPWPVTYTMPTISAAIAGQGYEVPGVIYTERSKQNGPYGANMAFDGTFASTYSSRGGTPVSVTQPEWIQVQFPRPYKVDRYKLWANIEDAPIDWTLQGSSDGTNWSIVDTRTNSELPTVPDGITFDTLITDSYPHGDYTVQSPASYTRYRLNVTKTGGGRNFVLKIAEMQLFDAEILLRYGTAEG